MTDIPSHEFRFAPAGVDPEILRAAAERANRDAAHAVFSLDEPSDENRALHPRGNDLGDYGPRVGMQTARAVTSDTDPISMHVTEQPDSEGVISVEVRMPGTTKLASPRRRKPIVESRHGDSERDLPGQPGYHEPHVPLTDEEKAQGIAGLARARKYSATSRSGSSLPQGPIAPIPEDMRALGLSQIEKIRKDNPFLRPKQ